MPPLSVRPASIADLLPILRASALDCEARGRPMWPQEALTEDQLSRQYPGAAGHLGWLGDQPVAAMLLVPADLDYWPNDPAGEALYLHKLAVDPGGQGHGLGVQMIGAAIQATRAAGRPWLRLDTAAERPKLRALYEGQGFRLVREGQHGGWRAAWYELRV